MSARRPKIGFSLGVESRPDARPPRALFTSDSAISASLDACGANPVALPHLLSRADDYLDGIDGLFVPGGPYQFPSPTTLVDLDGEARGPDAVFTRRARFERALVDQALRRDLPILGVCGGFQVLNSVFGGRLIVDLAAENEVWRGHLVPVADQFAHDVIVAPGTKLAAITGEERFSVNSLHRQGVIDHGQARASAHSPDGLVEAIESATHSFVVGVQWHPEFLLSPADERLICAFVAAATQKRSMGA